MKHIVIISVVLFHVGLFAQNPVYVEPTFGRYGGQGNECISGRGVCSFAVSIKDNGIFLRRGEGNSILIIQLSKIQISLKDQISIFGKSFKEIKENEPILFLQEDDFIIDNETLRKLDFPENSGKISKGNYPIIVTKDAVEIFLSLKIPE